MFSSVIDECLIFELKLGVFPQNASGIGEKEHIQLLFSFLSGDFPVALSGKARAFAVSDFGRALFS